MEKRVQDILRQMTLEEKCSLLSVLDFWYLQPAERFDLPAIMVTDGPHGLQPDAAFDADQHHARAREIAGECMVLLKNDNALLPLSPAQDVAMIGSFAEKPRCQGGGGSHIFDRLESIFAPSDWKTIGSCCV